MKLSLEEQEVHFSMSADEADTWYCYSDYPKWQRKIEKVGGVLIKEDAFGKHYTLRANQLSLRTGISTMSEETRALSSQRMRALRQSQLHASVEEAKRASNDDA